MRAFLPSHNHKIMLYDIYIHIELCKFMCTPWIFVAIIHLLRVCNTPALFIVCSPICVCYEGIAFKVVGHALRVADADCTCMQKSHLKESQFSIPIPDSKYLNGTTGCKAITNCSPFAHPVFTPSLSACFTFARAKMTPRLCRLLTSTTSPH